MNLGNESETVEFKKSTGEHKEALQAICAMLNKHGRGELYFGVNNNGEVVGQSLTDATVRQIASWISDKIDPSVFPTIEQLETKDGVPYIRVAFSGMDAPYSADGRYFIRVGTSNKAMTSSELQTAMVNKAHRVMPWDSLSSGRPISDVDEKALREFIELGVKAGRIDGEFTSSFDVLSRLGMLAKDGMLTNAAVELFCHAPLMYPRMKLGLLAGNDKLEIFDLRQEGLPMIQLLKRAEFFVISNIRRRFIFGDPGMQRREVPEIPRESIRESIANALCHRDYTSGTAIEVNVYMDFVEIVNPGLFPEGDCPENHLKGTGGDFKLRNPNIAQALFRSGMIEQFGTGIPRIKKSCDAAGVAFAYRQTANTTAIRFSRPGAQVNGISIEQFDEKHTDGFDIKPTDLSDAERVAVDLARKSGQVTKRGLMQEAGIGKTKATNTLKKLVKNGLLVWVGKNTNDPYQYYRLPKDGQLL